VYKAQLNVPVTQEMYDFVDLMATRNHVKKAEVVRQAIREHLDIQEDLITSRSRLGRTVMRELERMHSQFLAELGHISKLLLAAVLVLMLKQGVQPAEAAEQIASLAKQPGIGRMLNATRK